MPLIAQIALGAAFILVVAILAGSVVVVSQIFFVRHYCVACRWVVVRWKIKTTSSPSSLEGHEKKTTERLCGRCNYPHRHSPIRIERVKIQ